MDQITKNIGLQHIAEEIFKHLDKENLMNCRKVSQSWKDILDGPMFLLKRIENTNIPTEIKKNWKMLIKELEKVENLDQTEFDFILENIFEMKPKNPLKIVLELAEAKKHPNLVTFMLEYMDQKASINAKVTFRQTWREPAWIFGLTPIHIGSLYGFESFIEKQMAKFDDDSNEEIPKMPIHLLTPEQDENFLHKFADYIEKVAMEVHEGRKIKSISVSASPISRYTQLAINDEQGILTPVVSRVDYLNYLKTVVCHEDMVFGDYFITDEGFAEINSWKENQKHAI